MSDVADQKPAAVEEVAPAVAQPEQEQPVDTPVDTPAPTEPEEDAKSKRVTLADLSAKGTRLYGNKQYDDAADIFAKAAELQAEINGDEINPDNAEILFLYGRSLFKVGQSKSDVLGGKAPAESKPEKPKKKAPTEEAKTDAEKITQEGVAAVAEATSGAQQPETTESKKPLFQFEGDENFDQSDEEEGDDDADEEEEEEVEDDLQVAHDILEIARVSYEKHLKQLNTADEESSDKGKEVSSGDNAMIRHVKERLADTHDLLAEIHLENENFPAAALDSRASLKFKKELYPQESEILAEAHFKLSLALEFASVTTTKEEQGAAGGEQAPFDEDLRNEAISELEAAIASTRLKLQAKEVELAEMASPEENVATKASISDVRDIIEDMEQRLKEMKKPPVDLQATLEAATGGAMQGILGSVLGESAAQTEARIEEAKKTATDLSGLVRKKKKDEPATSKAPANGADSNGTKRKAEEPADEDASKKAKIEETA